MRTAEQNDLAAAVRALVGKHADDPALWERLCEQIGVSALVIPEDFGGAGGTLADAAAALEEVGYSLASTPQLASLIASEALLGSESPDAELLSRIAAGEVATILGATAGSDPGDFTVTDGRISGTATNVLHGDAAAIVLVATPDGLYEVSPGVITAQQAPAMDPNLRLATVQLDDASGRLLASDNSRDHSRTRTALLVGVSALAVGCAQRGLDMTVAYSKERVQFGRQIGSFQALKHRMADMLVLVEMARSAAWSAAAGELDPVIAAAYCTEAAQKVAAETIQLHGGIAITWEHDAHLVFKRAHALSQLAGQPHVLRASQI
ncbi:MAG TPA: acyl-CoA dehydrogenase family protein [Aeromicrobium sp.]|nr:acyl-CoA dehydrogenase family protein [Aeromicrobium sp.]